MTSLKYKGNVVMCKIEKNYAIMKKKDSIMGIEHNLTIYIHQYLR